MRDALGIACVSDFTVRDAIAAGELVTVLDDLNRHQNTFRMLWPSSKHLAPKLRVFIDFMSSEWFK
ncbi:MULTISPECIES: LysR substrate-binding domain-containing protein [unclassified Pseudomonas]|uniref:LysR substrate-binding domain-containing protein n=1 Tax=unclassified Pseudomonas TaxID=196821 RepID=UPI0030DD91D6